MSYDFFARGAFATEGALSRRASDRSQGLDEDHPVRQLRVSIVVCAYNNAPFIAESIDSLCAQRYDNKQIIVINDGSTDDTLRRARAFEKNGVAVVDQDNRGVSGAINRGLDLADGDLILLQGGDDVAFPDRIARQVDLFETTTAGIVTCRPKLIDGAGVEIAGEYQRLFQREVASSAPWAMFAELFYKQNFICAPAVGMRRSAVQAVGRAHHGLLQLGDYEYWLRASTLGQQFLISDEPWLAYRRHDRNLSRPEHLPRDHKEFIYILGRMAHFAHQALLINVLRFQLPQQKFHDRENVPKAVALPFLYAHHTHPQIRQLGYNMLLDLIDDPASENALAHHFEFRRRDLYDLLLS